MKIKKARLVLGVAVISLVGSLSACGSVKEITVNELNKEVTEKSTSLDTSITEMEIALANINKTVDSLGASTTRLSEYPVYETFEQDYKDMGNELVVKYMNEGSTEEEACRQAISDVIDKQYNDECEFLTKYTVDMDGNGVYDAVENGEITQREIDEHFSSWIEVGSKEEAGK